MQADEPPCKFIRRLFNDCFADTSPASNERAAEFFHANYVHYADGTILNKAKFLRAMRAQKARLSSPPNFVWKKVVAAPPDAGRISVTTVHSVAARLRDGQSMLQHVVALIEIDEATGQVVECNELTRLEDGSSMAAGDRTGSTAGAFEGVEQASADRRPAAVLPPAKQSRSLSEPLPTIHGATSLKISGLPLKRSGVSDALLSLSVLGAETERQPVVDSSGRAVSYDRTEICSEFEDDCDSFTSRQSSVDMS